MTVQSCLDSHRRSKLLRVTRLESMDGVLKTPSMDSMGLIKGEDAVFPLSLIQQGKQEINNVSPAYHESKMGDRGNLISAKLLALCMLIQVDVTSPFPCEDRWDHVQHRPHHHDFHATANLGHTF